MVVFIIDQQLWSFEVSAANSNVVIFFREVELAQSPVDNTQLD